MTSGCCGILRSNEFCRETNFDCRVWRGAHRFSFGSAVQLYKRRASNKKPGTKAGLFKSVSATTQQSAAELVAHARAQDIQSHVLF